MVWHPRYVNVMVVSRHHNLVHTGEEALSSIDKIL